MTEQSAQIPWKTDDPLVTVTITEPDSMTIRLFGLPFLIPELEPLTRSSFGKAMDHLYDRLQQPFTVEVVETDGSRRTGTIDLRDTTAVEAPSRPGPDATEQCLPRRAASTLDDPVTALEPATTSGRSTLAVDGFWPGEPLVVCLLVGVSEADQTGRLPHALPSWVTGDMVVAGRRSGVVRMIPAEQSQQ